MTRGPSNDRHGGRRASRQTSQKRGIRQIQRSVGAIRDLEQQLSACRVLQWPDQALLNCYLLSESTAAARSSKKQADLRADGWRDTRAPPGPAKTTRNVRPGPWCGVPNGNIARLRAGRRLPNSERPSRRLPHVPGFPSSVNGPGPSAICPQTRKEFCRATPPAGGSPNSPKRREETGPTSPPRAASGQLGKGVS